MKIRPGLVFVTLLGLALVLAGCSKSKPPADQLSDQTIGVSKDDAVMNAAIAKARSTLPEFWQVFEKPQKGESDFALKVKVTDGEKVEYFWAIDIERKDGKILGTINNDPEVVHNVKMGQRITIDEAAISDWLYMRDGKMHGNFTLRALFDKMPEDEAEKMKKILADP